MVITTTSSLAHCKRLIRSLVATGHEYHIIQHEWAGFLDKLHYTYKWLKANPTVTHFIYTDAWDTVALATPCNPLQGLLFSAERACYPHPEKAVLYPETDSPFKYVNGGGFAGESQRFIELYESCPPTDEVNDQVWLTDRYLANTNTIKLDTNRELFQTLAFCPPTDFVEGATFWHGNGHTPLEPALMTLPITIATLTALWQDTPESHRNINNSLTDLTNANPKLKEFRDYVEQTAYGFGERSFIGFWQVLANALPPSFSFLEIGVYRGQSLAAIKLAQPKAKVTGITPLNTTGGFHSSDYSKDISDLHKRYKLKQPTIVPYRSDAPEALAVASGQEWDVIYVDGGHSYEVAKQDIYTYSSFVKVGGYLVVDDCANRYNMPEGYFKGIETVSQAVDELLPNDYFCELFSVVHIRVFKRIK